MKFHKRVLPALLAAATVALSSFAPNAMAGSSAYGRSVVMPTIYSKNLWSSVAPSVPGGIPSTATVTIVYYSYSYNYPLPAGRQVFLCDNMGDKCGDVTYAGSGSVDFRGEGVKANMPVRFFVRVNGTGTMSPWYGGSANMTVNYTY